MSPSNGSLTEIDESDQHTLIKAIAEQFEAVVNGLNDAMGIVYILFEKEQALCEDFLFSRTASSAVVDAYSHMQETVDTDRNAVLSTGDLNVVISEISSMRTVADIEAFFNTSHAKLENRTPSNRLMKYVMELQDLSGRLTNRLSQVQTYVNFPVYLDGLMHSTTEGEHLSDRLDRLDVEVQELQSLSLKLTRLENVLGTDNKLSKMLAKIESVDRTHRDVYSRIINLEQRFSENDELAFFLGSFENSIMKDEVLSKVMFRVNNSADSNLRYSVRLAKLEHCFACCRQCLLTVSNSSLIDIIRQLYETIDKISEKVDLHLVLIGDGQPKTQTIVKGESLSQEGIASPIKISVDAPTTKTEHSSSATHFKITLLRDNAPSSLSQSSVNSVASNARLVSLSSGSSMYNLDDSPSMVYLLRQTSCILKAVTENAPKQSVMKKNRSETASFWELARGFADALRSEQTSVEIPSLPGTAIVAEHGPTTNVSKTNLASREPELPSAPNQADSARVYSPAVTASDRADSSSGRTTPYWKRDISGCCGPSSQEKDPDSVKEIREDKGLESSG